jgi:uncharacterized cupredoxin-like copper-binding protein
MRRRRGDVGKFRLAPVALAAALWLAVPIISAAATPVEVILRDPSSGSGIVGMEMAAQPAQVPAGAVTFHASNESRTLAHEMLLVKVPDFNIKLPYNAKTSEVIEPRIHKLGEIPDLRPGASGALTVTLAPGNYLLLCNQPGHYKGGMWTRFTVSR